jgi:anti-sigma factor RsiW
MSLGEGHRHLLLWYVSGRIGPRERRGIDRHLRECEDCRAEVASLSSMMRSVRAADGIDHVAAAELALYEEEPLSLSPDRRGPIERHLAACPECREDFATLQRARRLASAQPPAPQAPRRPPAARRGWWLPAAAAAAAVAVAALLPVWFRPASHALRPPEARSAVFAAPRRGAEADRILAGTGPWAIRVLLPFDAREGRYRVEILRAGARLPQLGSVAATDGDRCLSLILPSLPAPGRYAMELRREPADDAEPYLYPFDLLPPTGRRPAR